MSQDNARETVRNTSIFSFFTVISRFLGLARDMLKAFAFGTSYLVVAFDIAFRLPNMLRNLVAEGALSQSFIPLYEEHKNTSNKSAQDAAGVVIVFFFIVLILLSIVMWFVLPWVIPYLINDAAADSRGTELTITLSRLLFPYIVLMSLASLYMAIQYSHGVFWAASFGPALLNIVLVGGFSIYYFLIKPEPQTTKTDIYVFSAITLAAAIVQLLFQSRMVARMNLSPRYHLNLKHPMIKGIFIMMLPAVFGAAVQELGQLIDIFLATRLRDEVPGAVSALTYSHRLIQLPIGVFGVAVATASLPQLSRLYVSGDKKQFNDSLMVSVGLNLFLLLPAAVGLIFLAQPVTGLIFERGEFSKTSTDITAWAVTFYAIGIPFYSLQKLFMSSMYARKNARYPAFVTFIVLIMNVSLSLLLMPYLDHGGLALGSSLAAFIGLLLYLAKLSKENFLSIDRKKAIEFALIILANLILAVGLYFLTRQITHLSYALQVTLVLPAAILVYFGMAHLFKLSEYLLFREIMARLKNRVQ